MSYDGPFSWLDLELYVDETLPPDHIKLLGADTAKVFRLDLDDETLELAAEWPEK